eukprot:1032381_1
MEEETDSNIEDITLSLPRFNVSSWTTRVTTNIGSRLRLKFSINKFNIGVMSVNDNSCRFPRDVIQFIQKDFTQLHKDNLIDHYEKTITISHLKRTFKKWNDIAHDSAFVSALDLYLTQLRKMFARAIKRHQLKHSRTKTALKSKIRRKNRVHVIFKRIRNDSNASPNRLSHSDHTLPAHSQTNTGSSSSKRRFEDVAHDEMVPNMHMPLPLLKKRKMTRDNRHYDDNNNMQFIASNSLDLLQTASIPQSKANDWSIDEEYKAFQRQLRDILILELIIDHLKAAQAQR